MSRGHPADLVAAGVLALLAALMLSAPAVVISDVPFDAFIPLDAGWRALNGQWPHLDYHTPVGGLYALLYGAAMTLMGPTERVLLMAPWIAALPIAALGWWVALGRLKPVQRSLFVVFVGLTAASPRAMDGHQLVFLASYNRIGWALVLVGMLLLLIPRPKARSEAHEVVVLTAVLLTLAWLKITYFALVGLGCGLALFVVPENRRTAVAGGAAAWLALAFAWLLLDSPSAYLSDLQRAMASAAPAAERKGLSKLAADLWANGAAIGLSVVLLAAAWATERSWRTPVLVLSVVALGLLIAQQSHDHAIPLMVLAVVFAARHVGELRPDQALVPGLCLALAVGLPVVSDVSAIARHAMLSRSSETTPVRPGSALRFVGTDADRSISAVQRGEVDVAAWLRAHPSPSGPDLAAILTEGAEQIGPHDRVLSVTTSHALTWMARTVPPRGVDAWYDYGRTFGPDRAIDLSPTLADVTVVLVPRALSDDTLTELEADLLPALEQDFRRSETPLWVVWRRTQPR